MVENIRRFRMRKLRVFFAVLLLAATANIWADDGQTLVVTATNASPNQVQVFDTAGKLLQTVATGGNGGASGNAGGIEAGSGMVAVVNFGSMNVSLFRRVGNGLAMGQLVPALSSPVSVAFGNHHLYILGTIKVESHRIVGNAVSLIADGSATLLKADGSAAQVGVVTGQLVITEKSNTIETVSLDNGGAVGGSPTLVTNIPANVNAPFGMATRGNDAYVTIAHADEISLVRNGDVLTTTPSVTQHAPCWVTLIDEVVGTFLYSSNSPSKSISRYAVYGQAIVQDMAVAATLGGSPTDIASSGSELLAVIDGSGHLSVFSVDEDGNLALKSSAAVSPAVNGVAIIGGEDRDD
jgi:hypothetical protein